MFYVVSINLYCGVTHVLPELNFNCLSNQLRQFTVKPTYSHPELVTYRRLLSGLLTSTYDTLGILGASVADVQGPVSIVVPVTCIVCF